MILTMDEIGGGIKDTLEKLGWKVNKWKLKNSKIDRYIAVLDNDRILVQIGK